MAWQFNICERFLCTPEICAKKTGKDCGGRFWEKPCINHGEHLNLNENRSTFVRMRMAENVQRYDHNEIDRVNRIGKK